MNYNELYMNFYVNINFHYNKLILMSRRENRFQKHKNVNFQLIEYYSFINSTVL